MDQEPEVVAPPCFVCGEQVRPAMGTMPNGLIGRVRIQPADALWFSAGAGEYGSRVWDMMDTRQLMLIICDRCIQAHPERAVVLSARSVRLDEFSCGTLKEYQYGEDTDADRDS